MNIQITNFREILEREITFEKGSNLLKGQNGSGKTTIFESVKWCLYGGMKNISIEDKEKTRVRIALGEMIIERNNRPERVKVETNGKKYSGDDAKDKIIQIFGTKRLWETSSYLCQDEKNFLLQAPQKEKTEIIKEILFDMSSEDTDWYKEKFEIYKRRLKDEVSRKRGEIDILEESFVDGYSEKEKKKAKKREEDLEDLDRLKKKLKKVNRKIDEYHRFKKIKEEMREAEKVLEEYPFPLTKKKYQAWFSYHFSLLKKEEIKQHEMKKTEKSKMELLGQTEIDSKNKKILKHFGITEDEVEGLYEEKKRLINESQNYLRYKKFKKLSKEKKRVEEEMKEMFEKKKEIEKRKIFSQISQGDVISQEKLHILKNRYLEIKNGKPKKCPSCKKHLLLDKDGKLSEYGGEEKEIYSSFLRELKEIEAFYEEYNKSKSRLNELINLISEYDDLSDSSKAEKIDVKKLEKEQKMLLSYQKINVNEIAKELRYLEYQEIEKQISEFYHPDFENGPPPPDDDNYLGRYLKTEKKLENAKNFIEEYQIIDEEELKRKLEKKETLENEISKLEKTKKVLENEKVGEKIRKRKEVIGKNNQKISEASLLAEKIELLISRNMELFLSEFNEMINEMVGLLFDGMTVRLNLFKKNKTNKKIKPNVSLNIHYKGRIFDSHSQLSGGEKNRFSFAFTLVFAKICRSKFIFLDECMAFLDEEWRERCVELIKTFIDDAIIVNVCHETTEGYYDRVIEM